MNWFVPTNTHIMSRTPGDDVKALQTLRAIGQILQYWAIQDPSLWPNAYSKVKAEIAKLEKRESSPLGLFSAAWWGALSIDTANHALTVTGDTATTPDFRQEPWKGVFLNLFLTCLRQGQQVERQRDMVRGIIDGRVQAITTEVLSSLLVNAPRFRNEARRVVGGAEVPWINKMAFLLQTDAVDPLCPPCEGPLGLRVIAKDALYQRPLSSNSSLGNTLFENTFVATPVTSSVADNTTAKAELMAVIRGWDPRKNTPYARAAHTMVAMALVTHSLNPRFLGRVLVCYQQWDRQPQMLMTWPYDEWVYQAPGKGEMVVAAGSRPFGAVQVDLTADDDAAFRAVAARSRLETSYGGGASSSSSSVAPKRSYAVETIDADEYGQSTERVAQRLRLNGPDEVKAVNSEYQADLARGRTQPAIHAVGGGSALDRVMANNQELELGASRPVSQNAFTRRGVNALSRGMDPAQIVPYTRPMAWPEVRRSQLALAGGPLDDRKLAPLRWEPRSNRISEAKLVPADASAISVNELYSGLLRSRQLALGDRPIEHIDEMPVFERDDTLDYPEPDIAEEVTQVQNIQRRNYALLVKDRVPPTEETNQLWYDDLLTKELAHRRNVTNKGGFGPVDSRSPAPLQVPQRLGKCTEDLMRRGKWMEYRSDRHLRWSPQFNAERAVEIANLRCTLGLMIDLCREGFEKFEKYQTNDTAELRRQHPTLASTFLYCRYLANHIFTLRSILALSGNPCVLANKNFVKGMRVPGVHVTELPAIDPIEVQDDAHDGEEPRIELLFQELFKENYLYLTDYSRELVQAICDRRIRLRISCEELDEYDARLSAASAHYDELGLLTALNPDGTYQVDLSFEEKKRSDKMEEIEVEILELMRLRWVADRLHLGYLFSDEDFMNEMFAEVQKGLNEELEHAKLEDQIYKRDDDEKQEVVARTNLSHCQLDVLIQDGVEVFEEERALAFLNKILADITEEPTPAQRLIQAPAFTEPFDVTANDDHLIFVRELFARAAEKSIHFNYSAKRDYVSRDNSAPHNFIENRQLSTLSATERQVVEAIRTAEALYSYRPSRALHFRASFEAAWRIRTTKVREMKQSLQESIRRREQGSKDVSAEIDRIEAKFGMIPENTASASGFRVDRPQAGFNLHGAALTENELKQIEAIHAEGANTETVLKNLFMERVRRVEDGKEWTELVERQESPQMKKVAAYIREIGPKLEEARKLAAASQINIEQLDEQADHMIATHTEKNEAKEMATVAAQIQVAGIGQWVPLDYTHTNELARHGELLWQVREARTRRMEAGRQARAGGDESNGTKKSRKPKNPKRSVEPQSVPEIYEMDDALQLGAASSSSLRLEAGSSNPRSLVISAASSAPSLWRDNVTSARLDPQARAPFGFSMPSAARPSVMEIDEEDEPEYANSSLIARNPTGNWFQRQ